MLMQAGRIAEFGDLIADTLGALAACVLFRQLQGAGWNKVQGELETDG
jgi:VanZ family protein